MKLFTVLLGLFLFSSSVSLANCITKDEAIEAASQLFLNEYFGSSSSEIFEGFYFYLNEKNFSEDKYGVKEAFLSSDYKWENQTHRFETVAYHTSYSETFVVNVTCEGLVSARVHTEGSN